MLCVVLSAFFVNWVFREKKLSRRSSLKVLDYSMQGAEGTENCSKFIEFLGLRSLFPLFMKVRYSIAAKQILAQL